MRTVLLVSAAALLTLAACNKSGGGAARGSAAPGAAATPAGAASLALPTRKAGLWEETMMRDGKPGPLMGKIRLCLDAASDAKMNVFGRQMAHGMCQTMNVSRGADGSYLFTHACSVGPMGKFVAKGVATGDFSSAYTVHTETDWQGAPTAAVNGHHTADMSATWAGPCPADMRPGDVVMPSGIKVNVADMGGGGDGGSQ